MKALSIRQPWAWLIVHGYKDVENQSWSTDYRGPVLVHAGKTLDPRFDEIREDILAEGGDLPDRRSIERGGIVGRVEDLVRIAGLQLRSAWDRHLQPAGDLRVHLYITQYGLRRSSSEQEVLSLETHRLAARRMYRVDAETSSVGFCVRHFPFQEFRGQFRNIVGGLALPPDPSQYGHALLLIHSASLISENSDLVPLVIGHSFIDAERYPEILFVGRRFVWLNDRQARIYGELTLHGRKQPVVFNVDVEHDAKEAPEGDRRIRIRGTTLVNRFQFDMSSYRYFVSEQVQLCLAAELVRWEY